MIIEFHKFPTSQFYEQSFPKRQIVLHHTVSGSSSADGDISWWKSNEAKIATPGIITADGTYHRLFSTQYWAHHLGVPRHVFSDFKINTINNTKLNQQSIGIEIDSGGALVLDHGEWKTKFGTVIPNDQVTTYTKGYRGYYAYEKYTDKQLATLQFILRLLSKMYDIPLHYNDDMWDVTRKALVGEPGVWSHTSYRSDKSDCHPQPELIDMLKSLTTWQSII